MREASLSGRTNRCKTMSSGRPGRFMGDAAAAFSILNPFLLSLCRSIGVSTNPGGMLFTVTPLDASSNASDFVSDITAPLEEEYADIRALPPCALDEEMLTTRPQPAASMSGRTALVQFH